ncbi:MAG: MFS transporter [Acetobacteraceae bacterium]|nr:MFS transporter [Acetobacteraceae bacterium]MBV8525821.1 MFS transporter [Acetobacteraceae bacterium]
MGVRVLAWCLYDWAYSAFNTVITSFVFATYFVRAVASTPASGAAQWAAAQAIAGLIIAALAAPLGAVADMGGRRRAMLVLFTIAMAGCTASLWFVRPLAQDVPRALILVASATIAFEIATVFYNAQLPEIAAPARLGRISGLAWGFGYAGGLCCLALCLLLLITPNPPLFGLDPAQAEPVRACAVLAGLWILAFAAPLLLQADPASMRLPWGRSIRAGLAGLYRSLESLRGNHRLGRFLLARMLYTDGLTTLFAFGAIYAAGVMGMDAKGVLQLGIALNISAGIGAAGFAWIEDRIGHRATILICLFCTIILSALVLLAKSPVLFWMFALPLGVFVGPAQAASRSLMAQLAPAGERNAQFGLYALSGRVTGFAGPLALGAVTAATNSQRAGMLVILVLLAAGAALLARVNLESDPITSFARN